MFDDNRIRKTLVSCGFLTQDALKEIEAVALRRGDGVYRTAIETGSLDETDVVSYMAGVLGVPSVSLEKFTAKQELLDVLPAAVVQKYRVLPVGLKPRGGERTLFVAMDDPQDLDALEAVSQHCTSPVVPLLAGPIDLDRALKRMYPSETINRTSEIAAQGPSSPTSEREPDIFSHVLEDLDGAAPSNMASALSMLDDIPRDRHEHVTSPTGFQPIQKPRLVTDLATTVENEKATSSIAVMIRAEATSDSDVSGFHRSGPAASSSLGAKLAAGDPLAAALAKALFAKGIITERELEEALEH